LPAYAGGTGNERVYLDAYGYLMYG
jgi:hypothetical protein